MHCNNKLCWSRGTAFVLSPLTMDVLSEISSKFDSIALIFLCDNDPVVDDLERKSFNILPLAKNIDYNTLYF